jgi:hypothetical protein
LIAPAVLYPEGSLAGSSFGFDRHLTIDILGKVIADDR